jgi:arginine repressor
MNWEGYEVEGQMDITEFLDDKGENMYESPINQILGEMQITYENECMKAVQSCGFDVNKEELTKALQYDRGQYEKGYKDGYVKAIDDLLHNAEVKIYDTILQNLARINFASGLATANRMLEEIAEQMKAGGIE